jgi:hypothetical protein
MNLFKHDKPSSHYLRNRTLHIPVLPGHQPTSSSAPPPPEADSLAAEALTSGALAAGAVVLASFGLPLLSETLAALGMQGLTPLSPAPVSWAISVSHCRDA